jgi:hypothetical protein
MENWTLSIFPAFHMRVLYEILLKKWAWRIFLTINRVHRKLLVTMGRNNKFGHSKKCHRQWHIFILKLTQVYLGLYL